MSRLIYLIAFTPSFERMRRFYEDSLDLAVRHEDGNWVEYDTGGARFALHAISPEKRGIQLRFEATDIDRTCAAMSARGVRFEHPVQTYWFGKFNEFWDPDERLVSLLQPSRSFEPGSGLPLRTVILNAREFTRLAGFYREHVGLPVADERPHWVEFDTGPTRVAVHARGERPDAPLHAVPRVSFAFEVDDLDAHAEALRGRGVHFASAPTEEEFGVFAELLDPDGNVVVFREPVQSATIEEELAEPFEDDAAPQRAGMHKPVRKTKATSRVALRPEYHETKAATAGPRPPKAKPSRKPVKPRSTRGAGAAGARLKPKTTSDPKRARNRPATGRLKKAERRSAETKKTAAAGASKSKPVKRAAKPAKKK